jgi:L-ascorbate metabolism protein UlaG (beta-lactamase superfamily)
MDGSETLPSYETRLQYEIIDGIRQKVRDKVHEIEDEQPEEEKNQMSPYNEKGEFENPFPTYHQYSWPELIKYQVTLKKPKPSIRNVGLTTVEPNFHRTDDIRITWLSHACMLVQVEGYRFLTDPVFGDYAGVTKKFGYVRETRNPMPLSNLDRLPSILDAIFISHDHFDHWDKESIQHLAHKYPMATFYLPMNLREQAVHWGVKFEKAKQMSWWDVDVIHSKDTLGRMRGNVVITCTPTQHWSGRSLKKNQTLWCSWFISVGGINIWNAGDTAFFDSVVNIRKVCGKPDIIFLPVGAYKPHDFLGNQHIDPAEGVRMMELLECNTAITMHYGTFQQSKETYTEILADMAKVKKDHEIIFLDLGGSIEFSRAHFGKKRQ